MCGSNIILLLPFLFPRLLFYNSGHLIDHKTSIHVVVHLRKIFKFFKLFKLPKRKFKLETINYKIKKGKKGDKVVFYYQNITS